MATLGEFLGEGSSTTKLLLHLNGSSADSSGNGNNGTDTNITYSLANGRFGQGAGFGSSNSQILVSNNLGITTGAITESIWVKGTSDISSGAPYLLNRGSATGYIQYQIYYDYNGGTRRLVYNRRLGNVVHNYIYRNGSIADGLWHNVILTFDGNQTLTAYFDGQSVGTDTSAGGSGSGDVTDFLRVGDGTASWANGSIDEVAIYNYAWSAAKIAKYYSFAKGRFGII